MSTLSTVAQSISAEGICNMALGHLKITRQISNLATDLSAEGVALRTFYNVCFLKFLEDFKWPLATTQGALALLEDNPFPINSDENSEWAFAYEYPSDSVNFVRILSGIRNEARGDRVPFRIMKNSDGSKMIVTDMDQAIGEWTSSQGVTEDSFTANMSLALSALVAVFIAPMVTGGDPFKLGDKAANLYEKLRTQAQGNGLNEEQMEEDPESEFVSARDFRPLPWNQRFR